MSKVTLETDKYRKQGRSLMLEYLLFDMSFDLLLIIAYTIITIASIYMPIVNETAIRILLGIIFILFIPGYSLVSLLFPRRASLGLMERLALSCGISIAVVPLLCLGLDLTPWGIRLEPIVISLAIFTVFCLSFANLRRHEISQENRFSVDLNELRLYMGREIDQLFGAHRNRLLSALLVLSILMPISILAYAAMVPAHQENFTEFYIAGQGGKAEGYPTSFTLGDVKPVTCVIVNHENQDVNYDLVVSLDHNGQSKALNDNVYLVKNNQTYADTIYLKPDLVGDNMKLNFALYIHGNTGTPYRECHLWINVTG